jgi:hypothetical protein
MCPAGLFDLPLHPDFANAEVDSFAPLATCFSRVSGKFGNAYNVAAARREPAGNALLNKRRDQLLRLIRKGVCYYRYKSARR